MSKWANHELLSDNHSGLWIGGHYGLVHLTFADQKLQMTLNQNQFKIGDVIQAQVTEAFHQSYDLYLAVTLPTGGFITLTDKNTFSAQNQAMAWQGSRTEGEAHEFINLNLPYLPAGHYCLYAIQSPEWAYVLDPYSQSYWKTAQQCFALM